ncbi:MAG: hypothetical protein LQ346_006188 [Caloplaca aetnensis]|nr:MAG: hypothetical protein LQ346_006188 [Caloplaca aetnensis]
MSSRSRAVLDKLAARAALQSSQPAAGIRNRPAMPTITSSARSSASTGRSQPVLSIRSQKAALQARQAVPTSGPTDELRAKARSLCEAAQARRDRQATAAAPVTVKKAEVVVEACGVGRKPHSSREDSASLQKQAPRPAPLSNRRQRMTDADIEQMLIDSMFPSSQASPSETSMTTGRSFSFVAPSHEKQAAPQQALVVPVTSTADCTSSRLPMTPKAPKAVKFHDIGARAAPIPILLKSTKALPKGILKKNGKARSGEKRAVRWRDDCQAVKNRDGQRLGEVEWMKKVPRWIGVPQVEEDPRSAFQQHASVLRIKAAKAKDRDVHPDPTKYLGRLWSWTGPDGQDEYVFGECSAAAHADCQSPGCNKKLLHQGDKRIHLNSLGVSRKTVDSLPMGENLQIFNQRMGYSYSESPRTGRRYPKDRGL